MKVNSLTKFRAGWWNSQKWNLSFFDASPLPWATVGSIQNITQRHSLKSLNLNDETDSLESPEERLTFELVCLFLVGTEEIIF